MQTYIRKIGNSAGIIIPVALMKDLGFSLDQTVNINAIDGSLIVKPVTRTQYNLEELLSQMNGDFPCVEGWEELAPVGKEMF